MKFDLALGLLRCGWTARREIWSPCTALILADWDGEKTLFLRSNRTIPYDRLWDPTRADILATDWIVSPPYENI